MTIQKSVRPTHVLKARVVPILPEGDPLQIDGEILRLQGLVAAYHRNLKQAIKGHQRTVLQKALRRTQSELRLARRQSRRPEAA
jgi:hypothetical protein